MAATYVRKYDYFGEHGENLYAIIVWLAKWYLMRDTITQDRQARDSRFQKIKSYLSFQTIPMPSGANEPPPPNPFVDETMFDGFDFIEMEDR